MAFSIQTNVNSLIAQENLRVNSNFQSQTIQRLTSGYRINQSGDDAAGLAIANKFRSDTTELNQGVRNANDGISTLQIIDGGMNNISKMLDRLRTLSTQSASDTFTGDRNVLNQEFQSLLTEIDRQAQSIGLAQGGQFAKSLEVFIGGGRTNTGALSADNGTVTVDLTASAVDTKSLGLQGFQVIAGSANLATGDTTVQKIVQNAANGTSGTTNFYFAGPGFSDNSKVKVSVNLGGVTDLNTLVTNINAAIQNAGNSGTSQAATAFKDAGIVASVHTASDGSKQLAFTSSSTAFQISAGDQMANALMGNFSDATTAIGYAISTTLTGGNYDATGTDAFDSSDVTVRITGAGMAAPVDVKFSASTLTVSDALTELVSKVNNDGSLQAAGISVAQDAVAGKLVFTSARGESFAVESTGDTTNLLGLGTFVAGTSNAVDYTSIAGSGYDRTSTAVHGTADLAISLNGAATPSTISIDLAQGDATKGSVNGGAVTDGFVIDSSNHTIGLTVDGTVRDVTLTDSTAATEAAKSGTVLATDAGITVDATNNVLSFSVDGGATQTVTLTAGSYTGATLLTEINTRLAGKGVSAGFAGTTAGFTAAQYGSSGALTFKSTSGAGAAKSLVFNNTDPVNAAANTLLGIAAPATAAHGTDAQTFTLADIAGQINSSASGAFVDATAANGVLSITTKTYGTAGSVQITAANATLGLSTTTVAGTNRSVGNIVTALNDAFATDAAMKPAALTATAGPGGAITIASGNNTYFRINAGGSGANANIGFGVEGSAFTGLTGGGATNRASVLDASGTSYIDGGISFAALKYGNDDQSITVSAIDPSGSMQSKTITLQNDSSATRSGRNIDEALAFINQQLQNTNNATLQKIVAVKDNSGGTEKINFLSSLGSFTVSTGSSVNADGLDSGVAGTSTSKTNGAGGTVAIDTKSGAVQAVAAVADAVGKLGFAQAAVGKGQNQLTYAVGLAQSQISNFSAAESRIRDADVAAEAANLTKAQVLQQASIAAMAQANSAPQAVLSLLRG